MRKIVAAEFLSLDGVMESPDKWHFPYYNNEMAEVQSAQMASWDTLLLGRRTYEEFAAVWPGRSGSEFGPVAEFMNNSPKLVASTTLHTLEWHNSTLIKGSIGDQLDKLKQQPGRDIAVIGSANLVQWLLRENLLDRLYLLIDPIVVGTGKRLFAQDGGQVPLRLVDSRTFGTGVLFLTYEAART